MVWTASGAQAPNRRATVPSRTDWLQWGGPSRNFMVEVKGLSNSWPAGGPRQIWARSLGEGHSSILVDAGRLYTMYRPAGWLSMVRRSDEEVIASLDAASGRTLWEHKYAAPTAGVNFEYGAGPHVTPLIVGSRLFAASSLKQLFALDKVSGKVIWSHDLIKEYNAPKADRGYSSSPLAYGNTVIVPVGGSGQAVMAFDQKTGAVAWKNQNFEIAPSSPIIINVDGQDQLLVFGGNEIVGLNPSDGSLLWSHPHKTDWGLNISTPVWGADNLLFVSSAYNSGSRVLHLSQSAGQTRVNELWFSNRMRVHIGTVIRLGDHAYGSSGDFGPAFITAIDMKTGRIAWQNRSFSRSTFLYADGKLIILDEDGNLGLATVSPQSLQILSRAEILSSKAWTVPSLAGTRLYVRDRKNILALDLG